MIKTVILDLGNVIVPVDFRRCHAKLETVCSIPPSEIPTRIRSTGLVDRFETGAASPEDFYREISEVLNMKVSLPEFWDMWSAIFAPEPLIPVSMLESLRSKQRLILLSNTNVVHYEMIKKQFSVLQHFDDHILSYKVGALKPQPQIYQAAIASAGCRPEECFFTDDQPAFVAGAQKQGIDAVQFHSLEQLQGELHARNIKW